jgi:hypothetical protein
MNVNFSQYHRNDLSGSQHLYSFHMYDQSIANVNTYQGKEFHIY